MAAKWATEKKFTLCCSSTGRNRDGLKYAATQLSLRTHTKIQVRAAAITMMSHMSVPSYMTGLHQHQPDSAGSFNRSPLLIVISLHKSLTTRLLLPVALKGMNMGEVIKIYLGEGGGLAQGSLARGLVGHQLTHLFSSLCIHDRRCLFPLCILRTRTGPRHALFRRLA